MSKAKRYNTKSLYFSDRIVESMAKIFEYPISIVEAPMGYGKTTAVREYLQNTDARVLWQRVYDSSPNSFWNGFGRLFSEVDDYRSQSLVQLGFPNDSVSMQEALNIIEEIELQNRTVVVIDDYHLLDSLGVNSFIEFLVGNEITDLHIVLTVRYTELQSLEELTLKGYLHHVTKETFEVRPKEIVEYYKLCGISLKDTEAEELYSFTEGWISALYLLMLNFIAEGSYLHATNIYKLIEKAVYLPFSEEIKDFLLVMCIFDNFTSEQASHMWQKENTGKLLNEITNKNAFVKYDSKTRTYQIHNIFTNFLKDVFDSKNADYKQDLYRNAAQWYMKTGEYLTAMHYSYISKDFENLLSIVELDKGNSIYNEQKELFIRYFEECPKEIKQNHPVAILAYAMSLMTFNEMELFAKVCGEFSGILENNDSLDDASRNRLLGEFELLLSFTEYNDIMKMSAHHQKACALLKEPAEFMDTKGAWTFGSPSVLYMFYRETGRLEKEVQELKEAMPYYYQLADGHGNGGEYVMAAEWYYHLGEFENAEIAVHKALYLASSHVQSEIAVCALFLQARLALMKGDFPKVLYLFEKMREEIKPKKMYILIHTIDICEGFTYAYLTQSYKIPQWITEGDFHSSRLYFPTMAFANIVHGRALLINGEYLKLLGIAEQFIGIASIFPNLLANIYTNIYIAAANERIFRRDEALITLNQALEMAMADKLYMPFVENCDFIKSLLEKLYRDGIFRDDIEKILELYNVWKKATEKITKEFLTEGKLKLTEREMEIAELAADGFTNKAIAERLFISQNTVKTQLKSIFEKLGVNSRALLKQSLKRKK